MAFAQANQAALAQKLSAAMPQGLNSTESAGVVAAAQAGLSRNQQANFKTLVVAQQTQQQNLTAAFFAAKEAQLSPAVSTDAAAAAH